MAPEDADIQNCSLNYLSFLRRWLTQERQSGTGLPIATSSNGNINSTGTAEGRYSTLLTPWDQEFESCIEPDIRQLVLGLIECWDCITYSSCEGHKSTEALEFSLRHVRLASINFVQHKLLSKRLSELVDFVNSRSDAGDIIMLWREATIIADKSEAPGIDLVFDTLSGVEVNYWRDIEAAYALSVSFVRGQVD